MAKEPNKRGDMVESTMEMPEALDSMTHMELLEALMNSLYIEDCHVSGMHDPVHTPEYLCQIQLAEMAKRVLSAVFGVEWDKKGAAQAEQVNKIPRRLDREGWFGHYVEQSEKGLEGYQDTVLELEAWEKDGYSPRDKSNNQ